VEKAYYSIETQVGLISILNYIRGFEVVFVKEIFNILLEYYCWDYAIKLLSRLEPKLFKIYPLSSVEQKELDIFLEENLYTRWI